MPSNITSGHTLVSMEREHDIDDAAASASSQVQPGASSARRGLPTAPESFQDHHQRGGAEEPDQFLSLSGLSLQQIRLLNEFVIKMKAEASSAISSSSLKPEVSAGKSAPEAAAALLHLQVLKPEVSAGKS